MKLITVFFAIVSLFLAGCSTKEHTRTVHQTPAPVDVIVSASPAPKQAQQPIDNTRQIQLALKSQLRLWKGTPYQFGGTTKQGVDCSAFVQNTFKSKLGLNLSRTTRSQVKEGVFVAKQDLKPGDIVFFRTGRNSRHNGVYIGNNQFIHASSSRGVTTSDLTLAYWRQHYWTARRIIN